MTSDSLDLVDFASLTPERIAAACKEAMDTCDAAVARIAAVPDGQRTFANTLLALEEATDRVGAASGAYAFMAYVSSDDALRNAARDWDEKLDKYGVALSFREDLYAAIRAFADTSEARQLNGEDARLLE